MCTIAVAIAIAIAIITISIPVSVAIALAIAIALIIMTSGITTSEILRSRLLHGCAVSLRLWAGDPGLGSAEDSLLTLPPWRGMSP